MPSQRPQWQALNPRSPAVTTTPRQATIGKSLVIKGEVTGSESLYIDGRVEGSINLAGNRVRLGATSRCPTSMPRIVVLAKSAATHRSDRVDIRSDGSLTGDVIAAASPLKTEPSSKAHRHPQRRPAQQQKPTRRQIIRQRAGNRGARRSFSRRATHCRPRFPQRHPQGCSFAFVALGSGARRRCCAVEERPIRARKLIRMSSASALGPPSSNVHQAEKNGGCFPAFVGPSLLHDQGNVHAIVARVRREVTVTCRSPQACHAFVELPLSHPTTVAS